MGDDRIVEFIFDENSNPISQEVIHQIETSEGKVLRNTSTSLVIKSDRKISAQFINLIVSSAQISEINFHEDDLSDVIAKVYKQ